MKPILLIIICISTTIFSASKSKQPELNSDNNYITGKWYLFSNDKKGYVKFIYDFQSDGTLLVYNNTISKKDPSTFSWKIDSSLSNSAQNTVLTKSINNSNIQVYKDKYLIKKMIPEEYSEYSDDLTIFIFDDDNTPVCASKNYKLVLSILRKTNPDIYAWEKTNKESISDLESLFKSGYAESYSNDFQDVIDNAVDKEIERILKNRFKNFSQHFNRPVIESGVLERYTVLDLLKTVSEIDILDIDRNCNTILIEKNIFIPDAFNIILPTAGFSSISKNDDYICLTLIPYQDKAILIGKSFLNQYPNISIDNEILITTEPNCSFTPKSKYFRDSIEYFFELNNKRKESSITPYKEIGIITSKIGIMRVEPNFNSKPEGEIPFGEIIVLTKKSKHKSKINGVEEYWYQTNGGTAWLFGGDIIRTKYMPFIKKFKTEIIRSQRIGDGSSFSYAFSPIVIGDIFIAEIYLNEDTTGYLQQFSNITEDDIPDKGIMIGKFHDKNGILRFSDCIKIGAYSVTGKWIKDPSKFSDSYSFFSNFNKTYSPYFDDDGLYYTAESYSYDKKKMTSYPLPFSRQSYRDIVKHNISNDIFEYRVLTYTKCHIENIKNVNDPNRLN
ncbi:MAG TPA: hypothetical protein PKV85_01415 [Spirochaetota bacterium]|nr:hypothetical protein [Spirochaetota bacterium]